MTDQDKVEEPPLVMDAGEAVKDEMVGAVPATVIVSFAVLDPAELLAVNV